ncbi:MAG: hypothetical protein HPKKFMNG_00993 [Planctomycetes bacterium]|nr:hypothetical protein [Planctomycetota bacterium]
MDKNEAPRAGSTGPEETTPASGASVRYALDTSRREFQCKGHLPSHVWAYLDMEGNSAGAVARYDAGTLDPYNKQFRQFRWEAGKFKPGLEGGKLPLYRLPDLRRDKTARVVFVEGEKCADAVAALGFTATTTPGGAKGFAAWLKARPNGLAEFAGRVVFVLADNDEPGLAYSLEVARALQNAGVDARLVDPLPWAGMGESKDVADWVAAGHNAEELRLFLDSANPFADQSRVEIECEVQPANLDPLPAPPFDALPGTTGDYIQAVGDSCCVDPALPFTFAMGVGAASIGRAADIQIDATWREFSPLWLCSVAAPGALKSPVLRMLAAPIFEHDRELDAIHAAELDEWKARCDLLKPHQARPERPRRKQAVVSDTTIEALAPVLDVSPRVLAYHDELGGMFDSMGCYKARGGHDRSVWLSLYNCARITVNRKSNPDPLIVELPRLGIVGATTPAKAAKLVIVDAGDGGVDRFYFTGVMPRERVWPKPPIPAQLQAEFHARIGALCRLPAFQTRLVTLTPEASDEFGRFYVRTNSEDAPGFMQGVVSKHCGNVARIALMLCLLEEPAATTVSVTQMHNAIRIGDWLLAHTFRQRQIMLGNPAGVQLSQRAQAALNWVRRHGKFTTVSEMLAGKMPGIDNAEIARATLAELAAVGQGRWQTRRTPAGREAKGFAVD